MPDSPPQVIHMPLEELLDSDLAFDDPDCAGDNPTAYVLKSDVDQMAEALRWCISDMKGEDPENDAPRAIDDDWHEDIRNAETALAAYREAKG